MNFSTNQVRQFYVLDATVAAVENVVLTHAGTGLKQLAVGGTTTDLINPAKITHIETTRSTELQVKDKTITVKLKKFEAGKTYTFKVLLANLYGAGDETSTPIIAVAKADTEDALYTALVEELTRNVKKYNALEFKAAASTAGITVTTTVAAYNEGFDPAVAPIKEVKAELLLDGDIWNLEGKKWTEAEGSAAITSGAKLAELEWFCMGERADQYRMVGYPNVIKTDYKIDPAKEYDVVDICYYHTDNKEGVQRSDKVITLAIPAGAKVSADAIVGKLNGTVESGAGTNTDVEFLDAL